MMLCVVPQPPQANASSPGCPLAGAISATLRIARPHRLQIVCATGLNIVTPPYRNPRNHPTLAGKEMLVCALFVPNAHSY
jgi:hypothetical protein